MKLQKSPKKRGNCKVMGEGKKVIVEGNKDFIVKTETGFCRVVSMFCDHFNPKN